MEVTINPTNRKFVIFTKNSKYEYDILKEISNYYFTSIDIEIDQYSWALDVNNKLDYSDLSIINIMNKKYDLSTIG